MKSKLNLSFEELTNLRSNYFHYEIASMFGVHKHTVLNLCKKLGVTTQPWKRLQNTSARNVSHSQRPMLGKHHTEETKNKISARKQGRSLSKECRNKIRASITVFLENNAHPSLGKHRSSETKRKISLRLKGKTFSEEHSRKISVARKKMFQNPMYRKQLARQLWKAKPTSLERYFISFCQEYNLPFRYVGNGEIWIAGRNPDFININGEKQVIEILGNYWHTKEETQERIEHYAKYGFECIAIWEDELKDENLVLTRLGVK